MTRKRKPADQDEAIEQAFVEGVLPDEDRRSEEDRREDERRAPEAIPEIVPETVAEVVDTPVPALAVSEPETPVVPAPAKVPTPYAGKRFRVHDPENPNRLRWADESGELLPDG